MAKKVKFTTNSNNENVHSGPGFQMASAPAVLDKNCVKIAAAKICVKIAVPTFQFLGQGQFEKSAVYINIYIYIYIYIRIYIYRVRLERCFSFRLSFSFKTVFRTVNGQASEGPKRNEKRNGRLWARPTPNEKRNGKR